MGLQSASYRPSVDFHIHCVVLTSWPSEFSFLRNIFRLAGLRMHHAGALSEADFLLTVTGSTVLLADVGFGGGSWQNAIAMLTERHPLVPMLVIAERADWRHLADLYDRGACGVIWKPFDFQATRRQIRTLHEAFKERLAWREETAGQQTPLRWADSRK
jgi:DNA-binding NtrC family response regulator